MLSVRLRLAALPLAALIAAVAACTVVPGCGPATPSATAPTEPLPPYEGQSLDLFDDGIDAHAVGLELETHVDPKNDPHVRARAKMSDVVLRATIETVTGEAGSGGRSYQLVLKSTERIAGKRPVGDEFTLHVEKTSPSIGIVKSMEGQLVGRKVVVYVKAFGRPDGQRDLHFHASADEPDVVGAVKNAVLLDEMK
jgi:hypothetical protein